MGSLTLNSLSTSANLSYNSCLYMTNYKYFGYDCSILIALTWCYHIWGVINLSFKMCFLVFFFFLVMPHSLAITLVLDAQKPKLVQSHLIFRRAIIMFYISQVSLHLNNGEQCFIHNNILFLGQWSVIQHDLI